MKEKNKHRKSTFSDFERYIRGEMTKREENAFQRKLQKDPFAEEATEGFSLISPREAADDMDRLGKQLKNRIRPGKRIIYYSIAASVAVLMIISSVFLIVQRNKPVRQLSKGTVSTAPLEKATDSNRVAEPLVAETEVAMAAPEMDTIREITNVAGVTNITNDTIDANDTIEAAIIAETENPVIAETTEAVAIAEKKDSNIYITEDQIAAPTAALRMQEMPGVNVRGKILSSEDNLPIAGVNVMVKGTNTGAVTDTEGNFRITLPEETNRTLVADFIGMERKEFQATGDEEMQIKLEPSVSSLSELVVVGYGAAKSARVFARETAGKSDSEETGYSPPLPVNGKEDFDKYIEDNIRKPSTLAAGEKAVVVISFTVRSTGTIDNIKAIRSPGNEFSEEAIRLIREGPSWKPAEENQNKIDDEVRIRIVFK